MNQMGNFLSGESHGNHRSKGVRVAGLQYRDSRGNNGYQTHVYGEGIRALYCFVGLKHLTHLFFYYLYYLID